MYILIMYEHIILNIRICSKRMKGIKINNGVYLIIFCNLFPQLFMQMTLFSTHSEENCKLQEFHKNIYHRKHLETLVLKREQSTDVAGCFWKY